MDPTLSMILYSNPLLRECIFAWQNDRTDYDKRADLKALLEYSGFSQSQIDEVFSLPIK